MNYIKNLILRIMEKKLFKKRHEIYQLRWKLAELERIKAEMEQNH